MQRYMDESDRTSGLGGTSTCLSFFFHFVRTDFVAAYRPQFLRYRDEIVQARCHRGGIGAFVKKFDLKIGGNHAQGPRKKTVKKFLRSEP